MKLYELKHGDNFIIIDPEIKVPVASKQLEVGIKYWFGNIDGMYSYCKQNDEVVHLAAWTEVERVE